MLDQLDNMRISGFHLTHGVQRLISMVCESTSSPRLSKLESLLPARRCGSLAAGPGSAPWTRKGTGTSTAATPIAWRGAMSTGRFLPARSCITSAAFAIASDRIISNRRSVGRISPSIKPRSAPLDRSSPTLSAASGIGRRNAHGRRSSASAAGAVSAWRPRFQNAPTVAITSMPIARTSNDARWPLVPLDRLHTARRFCQLLAGGWGQVEAAKLAGAEAARDGRRGRRGRAPVGAAGGGMRWRRPALHVLGSARGPTDG